jgi:hypothetical protein
MSLQYPPVYSEDVKGLAQAMSRNTGFKRILGDAATARYLYLIPVDNISLSEIRRDLLVFNPTLPYSTRARYARYFKLITRYTFAFIPKNYYRIRISVSWINPVTYCVHFDEETSKWVYYLPFGRFSTSFPNSLLGLSTGAMFKTRQRALEHCGSGVLIQSIKVFIQTGNGRGVEENYIFGYDRGRVETLNYAYFILRFSFIEFLSQDISTTQFVERNTIWSKRIV